MTDKIDRILEASEHPERFSDDELSALLEDADTQELYSLMSRTASALTDPTVPDIDAEWRRFVRERRQRKFTGVLGRKAAAVAVVVLATLAVVATTIGVRHTVGGTATTADSVQVTAAAPAVEPTGQEQIESAESGSTTFRHTPLAEILATIAAHYGVSLVYTNDAVKELRLYFRWNRELPLSDVVDQLNNFEQINITLSDHTLTVE